MVSAGVPLLRALNTLASKPKTQRLKKHWSNITKDIQSGTSLGDSFGKHPRVFSDIYVNMVRAGEAGGILDDILKRLAVQQEKTIPSKKGEKCHDISDHLARDHCRSIFGLMLFVIPSIGEILLDLGGPDAELPMITQVMLSISDFYGVPLVHTSWRRARRSIWWSYISPYTSRQETAALPDYSRACARNRYQRRFAIARFARTFSSLIGAKGKHARDIESDR